MGTLKMNPCFLSKHRQWLKAPSRWQEVAKDSPEASPPVPAGPHLSGNLHLPQGGSPRVCARPTGLEAHPTHPALSTLVPGSSPPRIWVPSSRCRGPTHPNSNRPIHQTRRPHSSGESRDACLGTSLLGTMVWGKLHPFGASVSPCRMKGALKGLHFTFIH